jgi:hypothetical protein
MEKLLVAVADNKVRVMLQSFVVHSSLFQPDESEFVHYISHPFGRDGVEIVFRLQCRAPKISLYYSAYLRDTVRSDDSQRLKYN